jgi:hypothetical protein
MVSYKLIYWIFVVILTVFQSYRSYIAYYGVDGIGGVLGAFIGAMIIIVPAIALYFGYIFATHKNEKRNK